MIHSTGIVVNLTKYNKNVIFISDILILNTCFFTSKLVTIYVFNNIYQIPENLLPFILYSNFIWLLLCQVFGIYTIMRFDNAAKIISRTIKLLIVYLIILYLDVFFLRYIKISLLYIINYSISFSIILILSRILQIYILKTLRKKGVNNKKVVIVGINQNTFELSKTLNSELSFGYKVLGFFSNKETGIELTKSINIIGSYKEIFNYCENNIVDEIYLSTENFEQNEIKKIVKFCDSNFIRFKIVPNFQKENIFNNRLTIDFYGDTPILVLRKEPLQKQTNIILKRLFDFTFSFLIILILYPVIFPIVIIIQKLTSKGPVFFIQKRSGQDNQEFNCIKFRTMFQNKYDNINGTIKNDPRITPFGKFLRKSRIDELPQFINVFKGDMSVVGPRPHMLKHTEEYSKIVDEFVVRHFVKPGITGWAQTTGYIDESKKLQEMKDKIKKDIWYIENWSFALDVKIIALTLIKIVTKDKNAY
ncbi:MAG: undecaprenyl-phosphate glucose phosphotransferase [Bacteroidia bacterium]|nr:undecaprenyl-phosphate glucose phosphotransferase [Bacteroidia bacterium]